MKGDSSYLLEICYPTFNRPETLIRSVTEVLKLQDKRFNVFVSSNGPEPQILEAFAHTMNFKLHQFATNKGFSINVGYLLKNSKGRFTLLMSDEDTVDWHSLRELLDYLESTDSEQCVYYLPSQDGFTLGTLREMSAIKLSFRDLMLTHPMNPTYVSGYIFPTSSFLDINMDEIFDTSPANAYPFLKLRNKVLKDGHAFEILPEIQVTQGPIAETGGTPATQLYAKASRIEQYENFNNLKQQHIANSKFLRLASSLLIANQIQNDTGAKIYFKTNWAQIRKGSIGAIAFKDNLTINYLLPLVISQSLIKIMQKFSTLYRIYGVRKQREREFI